MALQARADFTPAKGAVLAKAVVKAADLLEVDSEELSAVVGMPVDDVQKAREGSFAFHADDQSLQAAIMFVRLFRSLDAIVGGNVNVARVWLRTENRAFERPPFEMIKNVDGLNNVVSYLDTHRAII